MVIYNLTTYHYTSWGYNYNKLKFNDNWKIFINLWNKETKELSFSTYHPIGHIICFFDREILQKMNKEYRVTLEVRVRIVCGMINRISPDVLSRKLKMVFMECIWDSYKEFQREYNNWYCKNVLNLPF